MNKNIIWFTLLALIIIIGLLYTFNIYPFVNSIKSNNTPITTPITTPIITPTSTLPTSTPLTYKYENEKFKVTVPNNFTLDENYKYQALGPNKFISGVKFTIDPSIATGTNLSKDSYISVETLASSTTCSAMSFLMGGIKSYNITDSNTKYNVASSSDAGAGNRYLETVYALTAGDTCIGIRYFIHYTLFENYPAGSIKEFDLNVIIKQFDTIRRTLTLK